MSITIQLLGRPRITRGSGEVYRFRSRKSWGRLADPYIWLDGYILDAQCDLGRRHGHPDTPVWVEALRNLASRSGMRELAVRSLLHGAALGNEGDGDAAAVLADELAPYR